MLKNYYKVKETSPVSSFLKELTDKKNSQYIILDSEPKAYVDIRDVALNLKNSNEKIKGFKKTIPLSESDNSEEHLNLLIDSGNKVIANGEELFDYLDAMKLLLEKKEDFLKKKVSSIEKEHIYALNEQDKISTARNLLSKHKVNVLPVLKNYEVIGEVRAMDFLIHALYNPESDKADMYSSRYEDSSLNLPVANIMNSKPITIDKNRSLRDAIKIMVDKNLSSLVVTEGNNEIYSVLTYRDVLKIFRNESKEVKYTIELVGAKNLYEEEISVIEEFAKRAMDKITKVSNYNDLKINFKALGNTDGEHLKKFSVKALISEGPKVISANKEVLQGTSDEEFNDKVKGKWNVGQAVQDTLKNLEKKVKDEVRMKKRTNPLIS